MYLYSHNENKRKNWGKIFTYFLIIVLLGVIAVQNMLMLFRNESSYYTAQRLNYSESSKKYEGAETELPVVIENVNKSVVGINYIEVQGKNVLDVNSDEKWGLGSGVIVSSKGYIVTNQHIAQKVGSGVAVTLFDGTKVDGKVVWNEELIDLAIIKVKGRNLKAASLGDSENIFVGDDVVAIGNPLGSEFRGTSTKGIISGTNRTLLFEENGKEIFMEDLIQTDASINPGNSGGPLIDVYGNVIGINTVKITEAEGIGFAVPINVIKPLIEKLEKSDVIEEAYLGIYAYDREVIPYMDSSIDIEKGVYISQIDEYGPCKGKGLKVGDIIVSVDGYDINKMIELREYIYSKNPGDEITLHVIDGEEKEVVVKLGKK